ncbi:hypothetical protein ACS0TY_033817 [Phlomoides rotata]
MDKDEESGVDGVLRGPYHGGMKDSSLLPSFKAHVATKIWIGEEHEMLKLHFYVNKFLEWTFPTDQMTRAWRDMIRDTGMVTLRYFAYTSPNRALICASIDDGVLKQILFTCLLGKMTIILDDVRCLTRLNIECLSVEFWVDEGIEDGTTCMSQQLGVTQQTAYVELYQLGISSRYGVKQLVGFIPLLEAWIYENFIFTRPTHKRWFNPEFPLARKWLPPARTGRKLEDLISYRKRLYALPISDVEWNPYANAHEYHPLEEIVFFHGCIRSFNIAEPYHPDRVLRQFNYVQTIPVAPLGSMFTARTKGSKYKLVWAKGLEGYYRMWDNHVLSTAFVVV